MQRLLICPSASKLGFSNVWNFQRNPISTQILYNSVKNLIGRKQYFCTRPKLTELNTNVAKDVVLFKYENKKQFRALNFFALAQFFFWNYLAYFAINDLRDAPVPEEDQADLPFWRRINLGENKYRNGLSALCFIVGYGILVTGWFFILKSVRLLVLRQGGKVVTFVTYTPFGKDRIMDVPLRCISAESSRQTARATLPLKVKNRAFYYVLDMRGEFKNPKLFDQTVGLKRKNVSG